MNYDAAIILLLMALLFVALAAVVLGDNRRDLVRSLRWLNAGNQELTLTLAARDSEVARLAAEVEHLRWLLDVRDRVQTDAEVAAILLGVEALLANEGGTGWKA